MNENKKPISVCDILSKDKYYIPLYQRNFAWGRDEIIQLLNDINKSTDHYYLGSLVVSKKGSGYEIIDGQQRHTTLSIINAVLKYMNVSVSVPKRNLYFKARTTTEQVFDKLLSDDYKKTKEESTKDQGIINILNAVKCIEEFFCGENRSDDSQNFSLKNFADRFYNSVYVFRIELPKSTDLNHYFEIMNNRGEQLEEHEILKAAFMDKIDNENERNAFAKIWNACSNMNDHIQMCFSSNEIVKEDETNYKGDRKELFGDNCLDILDISRFIEHQSEEKSDGIGISSLIKEYKLPDNFNQNKKEVINEKFKSIIDFPNFLLIVLKLKNNDKNVRLDSQFLLKEFGSDTNSLPDAMEFIKDLLKYRVLFDRYVIKRKGEDTAWNWSLEAVSVENGYYTYKRMFKDDNEYLKIRMIQSMLQVTFSTNMYKNWVFDLLDNVDEKTESNQLFEFLEKWTKNYYKDERNQIKPNKLHTPIFLFNYLDYILWVKYWDKVRGQNFQSYDVEYLNQINKVKEKFDNFKFVQRTSREHLFPQSRIEELIGVGVDKNDILNSFGNLCLISQSSNSGYNNDLPSQKRNDSKNKNESLKQAIMFASFDESANEIEKWNSAQILDHEKQMMDLLEKYTK